MPEESAELAVSEVVDQPSRLEAAFRSDSKDGADSRKRDPPPRRIHHCSDAGHSHR